MSIILVSGLPGVGKTTLIKRLCQDLHNSSVHLNGFYTEEVREESGSRLGFDVINLKDGQRSSLARSGENTAETSKLPKVGKYSVDVDHFEKLAMPVFIERTDLLVIDEIGKMELLSRKFENAISEYVKKLESNETLLIATIPSRGNIRLIETMKTGKNTKTFVLTKQNRNSIYSEIFQTALNMLKTKT